MLFVIVNGSSESITSINNSFITKFYDDKDVDFLIFMHSDVSLSFPEFILHVRECADRYDVMGLCGCESINVSISPLNWFTGSSLKPNGRWGCVTHGELGNQKSFFSSDRPSVTDHPVACVDGLCLVLSMKAIESGLRFNENLRFDCYDTDLCLDAVMNRGLRVGCLVEQSLVHQSVGKSILGPGFLDCEREMRKHLGLDMKPLEEAVERRKARTLSHGNTQN